MKKKILLPLGLLILICFSCTNTKTESKTTIQNQKTTILESNVNPKAEVDKTQIKETTNKTVANKQTAVKKNTVASNTTVKSKVSKPFTPIDVLRQKHACYLEESPFKKTLAMSEDDRLENGIPPNKYYESEWELTMNPET